MEASRSSLTQSEHCQTLFDTYNNAAVVTPLTFSALRKLDIIQKTLLYYCLSILNYYTQTLILYSQVNIIIDVNIVVFIDLKTDFGNKLLLLEVSTLTYLVDDLIALPLPLAPLEAIPCDVLFSLCNVLLTDQLDRTRLIQVKLLF